MKIRRIFFDMDGVLVDFDRFAREQFLSASEVKNHPGAYRLMPPVEGALTGIRQVLAMAREYGFDVFLATKPPTGIPWAYADKVHWVLDRLPELRKNIILTPDKSLLGDEDDVLVDDRPHRANCFEFKGALIHFGLTGTVPHWPALVDRLSRLMRHPEGVRVANACEDEAPASATTKPVLDTRNDHDT